MAFGLNNYGFGFIFSARDLATPTLKGVATSLSGLMGDVEKANKRITAGLQVMGASAAVAATGLVGLLVLGTLASVAGEFEFKMAAVNQIMGASTEEAQMLTEAALEAGLAMTQFDPIGAAEGLQVFAQAGFEAADAMDMLIPSLDMAAASIGQLDVKKASGLAVGGLKVFNLEADQTRWALDRMAKATFTSRMEFKDLPLALGVVARGAKITNASLEDTLISLALVRNEISTVERASTAVASSMMKLARVPVQKAIREMGVTLRDSTTGGFRPYLDIIGDLTVALQHMEPMQRQTWLTQTFQIRSVAGLTAIMGQLTNESKKYGGVTEGITKVIADMRREMDEADGTIVKLRDALMGTFKGQLMILSKHVKAFAVIFGDPLAKALKPFALMFIRIFETVSRTFMSLPKGIQNAIAFFLIFSSTIFLVAGAIGMVVGLFIVLGSTALIIGAVVIGVFGALVLGALQWAAVITFVSQVWKRNFGGIQEAVMPIIERVQLAMQALFMLFKTGGFLSDEMGEKLREDSGVFEFVSRVFQAVYKLQMFFSGMMDGLITTFDDVGETMRPLIEIGAELFTVIGTELGEVLKMMGEMLGFTDVSGATWKDTGRIIVGVIGWIVKALANLTTVVVIPFIQVFIHGIKMIMRVTVPFIKMFLLFGKLLAGNVIRPIRLVWRLWNEGIEGGKAELKILVGDLQNFAAAFVNFFTGLFLGFLSTIMLPLVALIKILPKAARTSGMQGIIDFYDKITSPTHAGEYIMGLPTGAGAASVPTPSSPPAALSKYTPGAAKTIGANARFQTGRGSQGQRIFIDSKATVEIDGETLQEYQENRSKKLTAMRGEVVGGAFSTGIR